MAHRLLLFLLFVGAFMVSAFVDTAQVFAGDSAGMSPLDFGFLAVARGTGGYLSAIKLGCIAFTFYFWVKLADWMNRDAIKIGEATEMPAQVWNPIYLLCCLLGFFAAISIPIFWIGFPLFLLLVLLPWIVYLLMRRSKMKQNSEIKQIIKGTTGDGPVMEELDQDQGITVSFTPAGATETEQQSNLIMARQSEAFPNLKEFIYEAMFKRADVVIIDYSQTQVASRLFVDGSWHKMDPMDRVIGDSVLEGMKHLADLNAAERRKKQSGRFSAKTELGKIDVELETQGVPTGERVQLKFLRKATDPLSLSKLGLFPSMEKKIVPGLNLPGITIVSAPPSQGLTSTWRGLLISSDRLTRDNVGIIATNENETDLENIVIRRYEPGAGGEEGQLGVLKRALLSQPDSLAVPHIDNPEVLDVLAEQAIKQDRAVWLQVQAKTTNEALLKFLAKVKDRGQFADALKHVTCQRLVRRLCRDCRQEVRVQPTLIKKLGGDPNKQKTLYGPWKLPPPEQRVDEKGNPIEFPPCKTCGGIGYIGRIAIFEMMEVNNAIREALKTSPKLESIEAAAKASKAKIGLSSSAYRLVLLGITSLQEVQAVLKK